MPDVENEELKYYCDVMMSLINLKGLAMAPELDTEEAY
jgi:hypothetical protein